jgi:pimeloyl-ACP methyl ester carboxylesterase
MAPLAVWPRAGQGPSVTEFLRDAAALFAPVARQPAVPDAAQNGGGAVLLIPAFLAGDWAMRGLRRYIEAHGFHVAIADIAINLGPSPGLLAKLDAALAMLAAAHGPVSLVGQSLGGLLARDLALRHPDHVRRVVTICSPVRVPIATPLAPLARLLQPFCDAAWLARRTAIAASPAVPLTALYSEDDGVVDWRECLVEETARARNVRVRGRHSAIGAQPGTQIAVLRALTD